LAKRGGPINLVGHHSDYRRIVGDGSYADIPILLIHSIRAVAANEAGGFFDLVRERCRNKQLGKKRSGYRATGDRRLSSWSREKFS